MNNMTVTCMVEKLEISKSHRSVYTYTKHFPTFVLNTYSLLLLFNDGFETLQELPFAYHFDVLVTLIFGTAFPFVVCLFDIHLNSGNTKRVLADKLRPNFVFNKRSTFYHDVLSIQLVYVRYFIWYGVRCGSRTSLQCSLYF